MYFLNHCVVRKSANLDMPYTFLKHFLKNSQEINLRFLYGSSSKFTTPISFFVSTRVKYNWPKLWHYEKEKEDMMIVQMWGRNADDPCVIFENLLFYVTAFGISEGVKCKYILQNRTICVDVCLSLWSFNV